MKKIVVMSLITVSSMLAFGCNNTDEDAAQVIKSSDVAASEFSPSQSSVMSKPKTEKIAARHESLKTNEEGTQYLSIVEETDDYIMNIEIPQSHSSEVNKSIDKILENTEKRFKRAVVKDQDKPSELEITFEKETLNDDLIVYSQQAELTNTNADRTYFKTFIEYDDELLTFSEMFDDSEEARELYYHYVSESLKKEDSPHLNNNALARSIVRTGNALSKVSPTKEGLMFQFDTLEIGGIEAGTPEALVEYAYISHLMTEECQEILGDIPSEWILTDAFAGSQTPGKYDTFYQVREDIDTDKQLVALTFDDGPAPGTTEQILDTLAAHEVKATFFVLGTMVEAYPELAKRIVDEGHEIANHTYNHQEMSKLNEAGIQYEIGHTQELIQEHTGTWAMHYRPPYGDTNQFVRNAAGIKEVLWDIDTLDWQSRNTNLIYNNVMTNVGDGSVVLMHDIVDATPQAVVNLMDNLDKDRFEFVTVSELYEYREDVNSFMQN